MDHVYVSSDSDIEFDQNELEVALYSQIHFDSSKDNEASSSIKSPYQRASQLFRIGVKELTTRKTPNANKPVFGGEFLAFSIDNCGGFEDANKSHVSTSRQEKGELDAAKAESSKGKFKATGLSNLEDKTPQKDNRLLPGALKNNETLYHSSAAAKQTASNTEKLKLQASVLDHVEGSPSLNCHKVSGLNALQSVQKKIKVLAKEENKTPTPKAANKTKGAEKKLKQNETLLPFSVTKAIKKPKVTVTENVTQDEPIKNTSTETVKRMKSPNPIKKSPAQLESFLQLSTPTPDSPVTKRKKRASLTKTVAAVKPRKPVVFLRRPPAVVVKYRQDSDTNTDYSDSDASTISPSPLKARLLNTLKESSQKSSPQHASEADNAVRNENITANKAHSVVGGKSAKVIAERQEVSIDKAKKKQEKESSHSTIVISSSEDENSETDEESSETSEEGIVFKEIEESISHEVYTSSNEDSESSGSEDSLMELIPGLEFNLDNGVDKLSADAMPDADNWKIADRDRHNIIGTLQRYFAPRSIQCRNCKADGHMSRDCPQPLKRRCIYCGKDGHSYQVCPNALCFNCQAPGHKVTECKESKRNWRAECGRCWMPGHEEEHCPDRWRQYHLTIDSDGSHLDSSGKDDRNPLVFCYNCGGKGHLGFECRLPRMNQFIIATYPFIARYDTKNKCKESKQDKRDVEVTRKTSHHTGDRGHQVKDKKIKQKHKQNTSLTNEHNNAYHRKHSPHNKDEGNGFEEQKRKRPTNQQRKMNKKMRGQSGSSRDEGNASTASVPRNLNSDYPRQKRKFTEDDMLDDFDNHQVNDNEWWNQSLTNKKKRRNAPDYTPSVTGNDWQKSRQKDDSSSQRSQAHRMDNHTPKVHGQWRNNRQQQLAVQEREERAIFSPQFKWDKNNEPSPRNYENRPRGEGQVSSYTHNQRANSFDHNASRRTHLPQASSSASFHKNNSNLPSSRNGFHARNDRFVAMKRSCDITIQIHK